MSHYAPGLDTRSGPEHPQPRRADPVYRDGATAQFYAFRLAPVRKLLHIKISGFWTPDVVAAFAADLHAAVVRLGTAPGEHLICCDVSEAAIQPQDIVTAFQKLIAEGPTQARKLAMFTTRLLSRMQARRIMGVRDNIAMFDTEAAALRWLAAPNGVAS